MGNDALLLRIATKGIPHIDNGVYFSYFVGRYDFLAIAPLKSNSTDIMQTLTLHIPDEVAFSLKETPEHLSERITHMAAVKLYELGQLSSGRAAQLAGVSRVEFLQTLGRYGVSSFRLSAEELDEDIINA